MADETVRYTERNDRGGNDLTVAGWEEMARLMEQVTECTKRCARAMREEGRHSVNFREAKKEWMRISGQQVQLLASPIRFEN